MKKVIALTLLAGFLAVACSSPRGGTSDQSSQSYGTGSSEPSDSSFMSNTNGTGSRTPDNSPIPGSSDNSNNQGGSGTDQQNP